MSATLSTLEPQNEFARGNSHISGIESFWACAKPRMGCTGKNDYFSDIVIAQRAVNHEPTVKQHLNKIT